MADVAITGRTIDSGTKDVNNTGVVTVFVVVNITVDPSKDILLLLLDPDTTPMGDSGKAGLRSPRESS